MTKPDWKDAPEWAEWLAQDGDGEWCWYETEPLEVSGCWQPTSGRSERFRSVLKNTLEWGPT